MLESIYALRYEVYCLECGFLPAENYETGLEFDEYDACSTHFAVHDVASELVGTVRLVCPPHGVEFPFLKHCRELFEGTHFPPRSKCGEVSRLVVSRRYRRRQGDTLAGVSKEFLASTVSTRSDTVPKHERRSHTPEILLGLYREMYRYSVAHGIRYWYAAMERSLARTLSRLGFLFKPIGPTTDYYGPVAPYIADLRELEESLSRSNPALFQWFTADPTDQASETLEAAQV